MVSVIVPVWNDAPALDSLLSELCAEGSSLELIVVDGGSNDNCRAMTTRYPQVRFLESARGRGRQMNKGAASAGGDILLFLHADTHVSLEAIQELPALMENGGADFGAFRVRFDPSCWLLEKLAFFTRFSLHWTCFGDQGIFVRRDFFEATEGFPDITLLEDVHWLRKAARMGRMTRSPQTVVTSGRRFEKNGAVRQVFENVIILLKDQLGFSPNLLAKIYNKEHSKNLAFSKAIENQNLPTETTTSFSVRSK